ncbi:hypothetical protein WAI453_006721 [Rhynchosporium graminicola]
MSCRIGLSWILVTAVSGLHWFGPQETISANATANWTPAPTKSAGDSPHRLFKKEGTYPSNLCGWQGPNHQEVYCKSDHYCAWVTDIRVVGCCSEGGSCDRVFTSCTDKRGSSPEGPSVLGVMTCTELCYRNTYPLGYYQFGCGSYSKGQDVVTSHKSSNPDLSLAIVITGGILQDRTVSTTSTAPAPPLGSVVTVLVNTSDDIPTSTARLVSTSTSTMMIAVLEPSKTSSSLIGVRPPAGTTITTLVINSSASESSSAKSSGSADENTDGRMLDGDKKGLSMGVMIGISVAAAVVGIVGIVLLAICLFRRQKQRKKAQRFLSTSTDGSDLPVQQEDPTRGTSDNPTELYQDHPMPSKEVHFFHSGASTSPSSRRDDGHTNSLTPTYELDPTNVAVQQVSPQSAISISTFPSDSPHPRSLTPGPIFPQYSHMYELPTDRTTRLTELDNSEAQQPIMYASYGRV